MALRMTGRARSTQAANADDAGFVRAPRPVMSVPGLLLAMLLPWAVGASLLAALGGSGRTALRLDTTIGYGFFAGVAILFATVLAANAVFDGPAVAVVMGVLAVVGVAAVLLGRRRGVGVHGPGAALEFWRRQPRPQKLLMAFLLAGCTLHLLFSLLELLSQPMFPWDAWTVWAYRAKAWFFAGELFEFVSRGDWLGLDVPEVYTQPALRYPWLASIVPLWAALGLGEWHETLVNLPVIFCGVAIALAVHGQARAAGVRPVVAVTGVYLLVSTPIVATHLSLGGYADIWLAGFAGLGFVALVSGAATRQMSRSLLGLALLFAGVLVKAEGMVWLAAGLLYVLLLNSPRKGSITAVAAAVALLVVAWGLGLGSVELPGIGRVGIDNGALYVPVKGAIPLVFNDVGDAYVRNAFVLGSWHLAWPGVLLLAVVAASQAGQRRVGAALGFLLLLGAVQALIFVFTSEGEWARDYTAINRLPLHVYPAVIFAGTLLAESVMEQPGGAGSGAAAPRPTGRVFAIALIAGLAAAVICVLAWVRVEANGRATSMALDPSAMTFVIGSGTAGPDGIRIDGFQDGVALLSTGPVSVEAGDYDLLDVDLRDVAEAPTPDQAPAFFWRRAGDAGAVSRITLDGRRRVDLMRSDEWEGTISEMGFLVTELGGPSPVLAGARLEASDMASVLSLLPGEWFEFEPWTQRSANTRTGGAERQHISLTVIAIIFTLVSGLAAVLLGGWGRGGRIWLALMLAGWVLLDVRWLANRVRQAALSVEMLAIPVETRMAGSELGQYLPWLILLRERALGDEPKRVAIIRDPGVHEYYGLRTKYTLLPHSSAVLARMPDSGLLDGLDYVLFLGDFIDQANPAGPSPRERLASLPLTRDTAARLELVDLSPLGALFRVKGHADRR